MVSDRGTLPRGAAADQQASWAEPTTPAGRRMPSAPRERKPGQLPAKLLIGDAVEAFAVGQGSGCGGNTTLSTPIATGTVTSVVGAASSGGNTSAVTLAVPEADAGTLACYASAQDVALT